MFSGEENVGDGRFIFVIVDFDVQSENFGWGVGGINVDFLFVADIEIVDLIPNESLYVFVLDCVNFFQHHALMDVLLIIQLEQLFQLVYLYFLTELHCYLPRVTWVELDSSQLPVILL